MKAAGTKVAYDHEDYFWKDKVEIPGPTKQVLKLMVSGILQYCTPDDCKVPVATWLHFAFQYNVCHL